MASIVKRKQKYAVVYYSRKEDGKRHQIWETFSDRETAERRKNQIEYLQRYGVEQAPDIITVEDLLREYVSVYGVNNWAMSTYSNKQGLIENYIIPTIGHVKLTDLNTMNMDRYYRSLSKVRAVSSKYNKASTEYITEYIIHEIWKIIRNAFNQAVRWGIMEDNPASGVRRRKRKPKQTEIWTVEEFFTAQKACQDPILSLAMHLGFACTMRLGEILGLRWKDVHISQKDKEANKQRITVNSELSRINKDVLELLGHRDVLFRFPPLIKGTHTELVLKTPKTESSIRDIYIPETVANMLRKRRDLIREEKSLFIGDYQDYDLVFCNSLGRPIEHSLIHRSLTELIHETGLKPVVFHSLRHSSITYKLKLTSGNMKAVQGDAGHSTYKMVGDVYAHILDEDRKQNAVLFEEAFYKKYISLDSEFYSNESDKKEESKEMELLKNILEEPEVLQYLRILLKEKGTL